MIISTRKIVILSVIVVAALMLLSPFAIFDHSTGVQNSSNQSATAQLSTPSSLSQVSSVQPSLKNIILNNLKNNPGSANKVFLPNLNPSAGIKAGVVQPLYSSAPAPMGVGYLGVQNQNGKLVGSILKTSSFVGTVTLNSLSLGNIANDGPDQVSIQLNTVMANTTLFGISNYSFWTQNVIIYTLSTHTLSFEDNIWNFSSPTAQMTSNTIYNSTGIVYNYPGVHIAVGPSFSVSFPFTVSLYLNTTVLNGRDVVYFNYSLPGLGQSGTYDRVTFNSTYGMGPGYSAPISDFEVNGLQLTPLGLPYDAEIMLGGPGGGTTNTVFGVSGSMSLQYLQTQEQTGHHHWNNAGSYGFDHGQNNRGHHQQSSQYVNVPSAYNFGTDTGETSEGMTVSWAQNDVAQLYVGPSLLYGMWGLSNSNRMEIFQGTVHPGNAFMFVSQGAPFNSNTAAWAPLSATGSYYFVLPFGLYSTEYLMSYYMPEHGVLHPHNYINLHYAPRTGIYAPLFAQTNSQLAYISTRGDGTPSNPYVLDNQQYRPINALFSEMNDYNFPVFAGVMLFNTDASVLATSMPSLYINMLSSYQAQIDYFGLPDYNYLGYWLYNVSGVTLWNNPSISGWFSSFSTGIPEGNVLMWNASNTLVGNNTFNTMDSAMVVFGGGDNTIFGNYFLNSVASLNATELAATNVFYSYIIGLQVYGSGNTIYNNYFATEFTAYSPPYNPYNGNSPIYSNTWNVTYRLSSAVSIVNGMQLSGSIVGTIHMGGNWWYDFYGEIPYNEFGYIYPGGDYLPLNTLT